MECPLCNGWFPNDRIEAHASDCTGEPPLPVPSAASGTSGRLSVSWGTSHSRPSPPRPAPLPSTTRVSMVRITGGASSSRPLAPCCTPALSLSLSLSLSLALSFFAHFSMTVHLFSLSLSYPSGPGGGIDTVARRVPSCATALPTGGAQATGVSAPPSYNQPSPPYQPGYGAQPQQYQQQQQQQHQWGEKHSLEPWPLPLPP